MQTIESLHSIIRNAFAELKLPSYPAELYQPISYTLSLGGKRLRPFLLLAATDMFEGNLNEAIHPALAIELFHNFTLLHDDLMDQAPLRRGKETVYKKWNSNIAILAGDTMFALANRQMMLTRVDAIPQLLELLNVTAAEVCEGQQFDMNFETRSDVTLAEYMEMIRLKTAVLLACSLKTGAVIAGASQRDADILYHFGINIGIAFQLMDDLLDLYSQEEKFGKVKGGDILEGKKTFLYLKALELAGSDKEELKLLYQSKDLSKEDKISEVRSHFDRLRTRDATILEIHLYWKAAKDTLNNLSLPEERKTILLSYCEDLMVREI
ncbi:MAG: polyprenyl synthetase family protein [Bacteroidetes bacterium]|nr:polyprenyl synthetase family protein [Bacteroidota bacterium]